MQNVALLGFLELHGFAIGGHIIKREKNRKVVLFEGSIGRKLIFKITVTVP